MSWVSVNENQSCILRAAGTVTTNGVTMKFEWDAAKSRANIRKHGLDFRDAEQFFGERSWPSQIHARTTENGVGLDSESLATGL